VYGNFLPADGKLRRYMLLLVKENGKPVISSFIPGLSYSEIHKQDLVRTTDIPQKN